MTPLLVFLLATLSTRGVLSFALDHRGVEADSFGHAMEKLAVANMLIWVAAVLVGIGWAVLARLLDLDLVALYESTIEDVRNQAWS